MQEDGRVILSEPNESPSKKEGKYALRYARICAPYASMKALPKRKGNVALSR